MTGIVVLKLVGLEYSGDSIGSNIRLEIEVFNHFVGINKKLSQGKSIEFNKEIERFRTNQPSFSLPVHLRIIERDPIFNDVGNLQAMIQVDLNASFPQRSTHKIEVVESGGVFGDAVAIFQVTLEMLVQRSTRYVSETDDGWLRVRFEDYGMKESLPATLKVEIYHVEGNREYFMIMEGSYRGKKASVQFKKDGSSYLSINNPQMGAVRLIYSISRKTLSLNSNEYLTKDYSGKPWRKGFYDVEIPDAPHRGGLHYPDVTRAKTWFRIGHEGDRYLHTGQISLGCITVTEGHRWDELYQVLIKGRKGDGISIGTLQVVE